MPGAARPRPGNYWLLWGNLPTVVEAVMDYEQGREVAVDPRRSPIRSGMTKDGVLPARKVCRRREKRRGRKCKKKVFNEVCKLLRWREFSVKILCRKSLNFFADYDVISIFFTKFAVPKTGF